MSLKSLLMVSVTLFLPACSHVEVTKVSEKLIPKRVKEAANITQVQTSTQTAAHIPSRSQIRPQQQNPIITHTSEKELQHKQSRASHHLSKPAQQASLSSLFTEAAKALLSKIPKKSSKKRAKNASTTAAKESSKKEAPTISTVYFQEGKASYYSSKLHGRKTASGEIYNENKLTAAHKHLPFGTKVRVINKANGRSVLVNINDRGPFVKKRILDLSYVAAKQLKMLNAGVSNIKMEILQ